MTTYGYARTSSLEQQAGLEDQVRRLLASGCFKVFKEQVSATDMTGRTQWAAMTAQLLAGDKIVITKIDRAARSIDDMVSITKSLKEKEVTLVILDMDIDTSTASGTLMFNIFTSVAQFERDMMKERQLVGIAAKKAADKLLPLDQRTYQGRTPTARNKAESVKALINAGMTKEQVAKQLEIGVASVYRILKVV